MLTVNALFGLVWRGLASLSTLDFVLASLLVLVAEAEGAPATGVFTLHGLMRAQAALLE